MPTNAEMTYQDCCLAFAESYEVSNLPAMRAIERSVLGCDYGGTSWTTSEQASQMIDRLKLGPGVHLLDIGAGSGWPGLKLAHTSGCAVTLVDLPLNALKKAQVRARGDGIDDRVNFTAASGAALPFRSNSFDVISHSDVLCCLPEKREMLDECRRVANDGAGMLFSVIAVAQNLSEADRRLAVDAGPPFVDAPADYAQMLSVSGWQLTERIDVTAEHKKSLSALINGFTESTELAEVLGPNIVRDAIAHRQQQIAAIDAGWLVREIFVASAV
jgi:ubiquinone/menaquinone biosynthesis C-methylase UbiE